MASTAVRMDGEAVAYHEAGHMVVAVVRYAREPGHALMYHPTGPPEGEGLRGVAVFGYPTEPDQVRHFQVRVGMAGILAQAKYTAERYVGGDVRFSPGQVWDGLEPVMNPLQVLRL